MKEINHQLRYTGSHGEFEIESPHLNSFMYFPLANEAGMMSSVTPMLHGDIKVGHHAFFSEPVSSLTLENSRTGRNFWVFLDEREVWSATGNSSKQIAQRYDELEDQVHLKAGLLWHKITRINKKLGLKAEILSFVPANQDRLEIMEVTLTNLKEINLILTPTAAIPIYGRSADNLRDHRHVTSLLNQAYVHPFGVELKPTLTFDERGHKPNALSYWVLGFDESGHAPLGSFVDMEAFMGEGGNLDWPKAVVLNRADYLLEGATLNGYETIGGLRFKTETLKPHESKKYTLVLGITENKDEIENLKMYCSHPDKAQQTFEQTEQFWHQKVEALCFQTKDASFNQWMKWVTIQPKLRQIFGCSFLPHHDYGRGGRGWRDLWQDCLALLIQEPYAVRPMLMNNFAGVRFDGSNATIIGSKPGEFIADRNKISRVWMDHGSWPFLTTLLYLNQTGDLLFLLEEQTYFKDHLSHRAQKNDGLWNESQGNQMLTTKAGIYKGSILEHLLIQHLTCFFNVGDHNMIKLEGADWNDGLDMAEEKGESVAFTALYGSNLASLSECLNHLASNYDIETVDLAEEVMLLLDTLNQRVDYGVPDKKRSLLKAYFTSCEHNLSGKKSQLSIRALADDLKIKSEWIKNLIQSQEWVVSQSGEGWFNGYYDNEGNPLESNQEGHIRMTLTGQVFTLMGGIANAHQEKSLVMACQKHLKDLSVGGYRLNTNFNEVKLNMGRLFGFAYGHKENGAMFSHMAVMYANALYKRGFVKEGYDIIETLYKHCSDFEKSRVYPGIPEYINEKGRGMYHYLTGSASWLLLTVLTEAFGVKGFYGDLILEPKLVLEQFDENGLASVTTHFQGKPIQVHYKLTNTASRYPYPIGQVTVNGQNLCCEEGSRQIKISKRIIEKWPQNQLNVICVKL